MLHPVKIVFKNEEGKRYFQIKEDRLFVFNLQHIVALCKAIDILENYMIQTVSLRSECVH